VEGVWQHRVEHGPIRPGQIQRRLVQKLRTIESTMSISRRPSKATRSVARIV
jgi:hypothetical protein